MLPIIKRTYLPDWSFWLGISILFWFVNSGCNTRIQGCLDVNAKNFDLEAERECDGCCTYPSISLSLSQKWNDENFTNEDTLYDVNQRRYRIQDLRYFLTTWAWHDAEGVWMTVDSVDAECDASILTYTPDNVIVDTRKFLYPLGTIRQAPTIDSIRFSFGLTQDFSCLDEESSATPPELTSSSPLWNPASSSLETLRLVVQRTLGSDVFDTLYIETQVNIGLQYGEEFRKGFDTQLGLSVNYAMWFSSVDIWDLNTFSTSILSNFDGSITKTE